MLLQWKHLIGQEGWWGGAVGGNRKRTDVTEAAVVSCGTFRLINLVIRKGGNLKAPG